MRAREKKKKKRRINKMKFPKKMMSIKELVELGYSKAFLIRIAHHKLSNKYIRRTSSASNAKILFDVETLDKLLQSGEVR